MTKRTGPSRLVSGGGRESASGSGCRWPEGEFKLDRELRVRLSSSQLNGPDREAADRMEGRRYLELCEQLLGVNAVSTREIRAGVMAVAEGAQSTWMGLCGFVGGDGRSRWIEVSLSRSPVDDTVTVRHRVGALNEPGGGVDGAATGAAGADGADADAPGADDAVADDSVGGREGPRLRLHSGPEDGELVASGPGDRVDDVDAWAGFAAAARQGERSFDAGGDGDGRAHGGVGLHNLRFPGVAGSGGERDVVGDGGAADIGAASDDPNVGIVVCDPNGAVAWCDEAFREHCGVAGSVDLTGRSLEALIAGPHTDYERVAYLRTRMVQSRPCRVELIRYDASGESFWVELDGRPLEREKARALLGDAADRLIDEPGHVQPTYIITEVDVSERKRREHLEILSRFAADAAAPPSLWVDRFGAVLYANEGAASLLGRRRDELCEWDVSELAPELAGASWQGFWDHLRAVESCDIGVLFYEASGQCLHTDVSCSHVAIDGAEYACLFLRDVSRERHAAQKLAASERRLRLLFEASHDGIVLVHSSGRFVDVNTAACDLFGIARDRLIASTVHEVEQMLWRRPQDSGLHRLWPRLIESASHGGEFEFRASGHSRLVEFTTSPVGEDLYLVVLRDVSDRGRTDAALRQVARGTSAAVGEAFLRRLTTYLAQALHGDLALIARLDDGHPDTARVIGSRATGEVIESFTLPLHSPAFDAVVSRSPGASPVHAELEERDRELRALGVRSIVALRLTDGRGAVTGALLVGSSLEGYNPPSIDAVLQIYGARAGAELERQSAHRQLADSERRYRELLDQLPDASIVHREGAILFANANAAKLLGVDDPSKLIGLDLYEFVHPNDRVRVAERDRATTLGEPADEALLEAALIPLYGKQFQVESTASEVHFQGRSATHLVLRDVSSRRQAERTLDRFFKVSPDVLCILQLDGRIVRVNNAFSRLVGIDDAELQRLSLFDLIAPGNGPRVRPLHAKLKSGLPQTGVVVPLRDAHDRVRELEWSFHPELHEGLIYGVARDVTVRLEQERTLRNQAQIIDQVHDSVISLDMKGMITSWNPGAERMFGYKRRDVLGRHISLLETKTESGLPRSSFLASLDDDASHDVEHTLQRRDGTRFVAQTSLSILRDAQQLPVGVIGVSTDISRRKALESELRRSQKLEAVGMLSSGIAHDFNNILTAIFTDVRNAQRALDGDAGAEQARQAIDQIGKAALQAREVTTSLLTFSRGSTPVKRPIDVCELLRSSAALLRRMLPAGIVMSVEADDARPLWVNADPAQLQQVIVNLCVNARDAMPNGGKLKLSATAERGTDDERVVRLVVSDNGVGIAKEHLERVFEPFFTTKPRGQGTGLGLAIIHGIVEEHGGKLDVASQPNVGTSITVSLTGVAPPQSSEVKPESKRPMGEGRAALLHCESGFLHGIIATMLEEVGFEVRDVDAGADGMPACDATRDLVLIDVGEERVRDAPGDAGTDGEAGDAALVRAARELGAPVLVLTPEEECGDDGESVEGDESGGLLGLLRSAFACDTSPAMFELQKPFQAGHLADALTTLLAMTPDATVSGSESP